mgnify:FL=1
MRLEDSQGYVLYKLPTDPNFFLRQGDWKILDKQKKGFIVQGFNDLDTLIIENEKKVITSPLSIPFPSKKNTSQNLSKQEYIKQVNLFIDACKHDLDKVILSRLININAKEDINLFDVFEALANQHTNTLVYLYNIPNLGMWMGATPETLIYADQFSSKTMALAGSLPITNKNINWGNKEIQEHQFVIDDITLKLKNNSYTHQVKETQTTKAGEVAHLKTLIKIDSGIEEIKKIADILHPTSAICGMPQEKAKQFILKEESHDREFYTGYLGELDNQTNSWLFVNLRCMQIYHHSFKIYVGGGITKDSIAEKEWDETQLKSRTLLSVIEKM